ncbi:unnamed protein product [Owenia fusiformis]|uniref:Uncharacterized protein n=1 Tax=Owenia fusiformis TaxID=6347 RepID=A0A8S4QAG8_OWEFU|nr:unnamed protein product [Owenia fusiformis]
MCEVLRDNLDDHIQDIAESIKTCCFIAIDTEFSGLKSSLETKPSLFDDGEERYRKLRGSSSQFLIVQFGLSMYHKLPDKNKYEAHTYNFYLYPSSFGPRDVRFLCQASSFEFLCKHNFDFNKFVYNGISYMNEEEECEMRRHISTGKLFQGLDREFDERELQEYCSAVAVWLSKAKDGETFDLNVDKRNDVIEYIVHMELRQRFDTVWTRRQGDKITVEKVPACEKQKLELTDDFSQVKLENRIMDSLLGFTRIFRLLIQHKKPLVGHNMLTDLLLMYDKFHQPLPDSYKEFKNELHRIFPTIIDTKHISSNLRKLYEGTGLMESTNLMDLYTALNSYKGRFKVLYSPDICHGEAFWRYERDHHPHEAGYDSFIAGNVFIRMCHLLCNEGIKSTSASPMEFYQYMRTIEPYKNKINVIRASLNHICLDGEDPISKRPELLYVQPRNPGSNLSSSQLAMMMSQFGSVDIKMQGTRHALVAVGNYRCMWDILKAYKKDPDIAVVKYNYWRHSQTARRLLWSGVLLGGGITLLALVTSNTKHR